MFKSLWKRFKENNFLAEGEEQLKFQEDSSVTKQEETPVEATLAMNNFTKMGVDTFTIYVRFDRVWHVYHKQLKAPTLSLLKLIKKRFDENDLNWQCNELGNYEWFLTETESLHLDFSSFKAACVYIKHGLGIPDIIRVGDSLNFLDDDEKHWIKAYVAYRLNQNQEQENQKKRDALEQKLQSILNEGEEEE